MLGHGDMKTLLFIYPQRKKSHGVKSGDRAGHSTGLYRHTTVAVGNMVPIVIQLIFIYFYNRIYKFSLKAIYIVWLIYLINIVLETSDLEYSSLEYSSLKYSSLEYSRVHDNRYYK